MTRIDITIEKLIYGGEGLAHHQGTTVFVPFVLPEERVSALPWEHKKKFVRARVENITAASPHRTAPRCPHFGACGGCHYQHVSYDAQLNYKSDILRETLRRIGHLQWNGNIVAHASPPWAYRNRVQWKIRPVGEARDAHLGIGYFRADSATLCAVEDCPILSPPLLELLLALREALAAGALPKSLREIEAFAGTQGSPLLLTVTLSGFPPHADQLAQKLRAFVPNLASLLFHDPAHERMKLFGPGYVSCEAGGRTYRVGHFSFFQVNRFLAGPLAHQVAENDTGGSLALDLFSGVGLFSAPLAERFEHVIAVESNPAAARDLQANLAALPRLSGAPAGHASVEVRVTDVEAFLSKYRGTPQLVVLDPPRAGLTPAMVKDLARIAPERITYVSCDPPTLARDLAGFRQAGYELLEVHLFDLFPQTFHMETVARLRPAS